MKFFILFFLSSVAMAAPKASSEGFTSMLAEMHMSVPFILGEGFAGETVCPKLELRVKSVVTPDKKVRIKFFLDEDENKAFSEREPNSDAVITKRNLMHPLLDIKSTRKQIRLKSTKDSILYLVSDFKAFSGTIFADVEDLKEKKKYTGCIYYVHQEIKK